MEEEEEAAVAVIPEHHAHALQTNSQTET